MNAFDADQPGPLQLDDATLPGQPDEAGQVAGASPEAGGAEALLARRASVLRKPPAAKFGAIDVGTNSIHLVMAEISPEGDFRILGRDKEMVQMGRGGFVRHALTARAMNEGLGALTRFTKMARLKGVTRLVAVATSAVREAVNGGEFVQRVRQRLGLPLHVVSAEEEARLIYLAVRHAVDLGETDHLILDVGGGSMELIIGNAREARELCSAKLGALRLSELFLRHDPPPMGELKAMRRHIEKHLGPIVARAGRRTLARGIATSGTFQNIATVCAYRRGETEIERATQLRVSRAELKALLSDLSGTTREERSRLPGVDARRLDTILSATVVLLAVMRTFDVSSLEYCDMALREGIIIDHIARQRARLLARATWPDPRARSVVQLAERCGYERAHAEQVARLALSLFDQLAPLHGLEPRNRELLNYACLLHDVGYLISHENHHKHSYYLIRNGGLKGFSDAEIEIIANIARYHRKGRAKKSHYSYKNLDKRARPAVRKLVALLRVANALDRTHYSVVRSIDCRILGGRVDLTVHTDQDAELELWTARRQGATFEREFGVSIGFRPAAGGPAAHEGEAEGR